MPFELATLVRAGAGAGAGSQHGPDTGHKALRPLCPVSLMPCVMASLTYSNSRPIQLSRNSSACVISVLRCSALTSRRKLFRQTAGNYRSAEDWLSYIAGIRSGDVTELD
eukprot:SAG31_NODE_1335_length_8749_cov_3.813426_3_plen_110_part_00